MQEAKSRHQAQGVAASSAKVAIVIVNYNCYSDLVRCLESVRSLAYDSYVTIIVDNDSPDRSGELILENCCSGDREIICSKENNGFAGGNNLGISAAFELGVDYIWLLNPDTEVESDSLKHLVAALEMDPELAAVGSKVLYGDRESKMIWSSGGFVNTDSGLSWMRGTNEDDIGQFDEGQTCDYIPGCSLLARSSVFREVGLLPERYFMYFEETDWCLRVRAAGFKLAYVPKSVVYHHVADDKMQTPFTVYYYNRNERLFWFRFGALGYRVRRWCRALFIELPRTMKAYRCSLGTENEELFRAHYQSVKDALLLRAGKTW